MMQTVEWNGVTVVQTSSRICSRMHLVKEWEKKTWKQKLFIIGSGYFTLNLFWHFNFGKKKTYSCSSVLCTIFLLFYVGYEANQPSAMSLSTIGLMLLCIYCNCHVAIAQRLVLVFQSKLISPSEGACVNFTVNCSGKVHVFRNVNSPPKSAQTLGAVAQTIEKQVAAATVHLVSEAEPQSMLTTSSHCYRNDAHYISSHPRSNYKSVKSQVSFSFYKALHLYGHLSRL